MANGQLLNKEQNMSVAYSLANVDNSKLGLWKDEFAQEFITSSRTAIGRRTPSAPLKQLLEDNPFSGTVLHYGKGKSELDSNALRATGAKVFDYDYVYAPNPELLGNAYDFVFASYVVNTLRYAPRMYVWKQIASVCKVAYVAARSDKIKGTSFEDGYITSIKTFQKSYLKKQGDALGELAQEAAQFFEEVIEIKSPSGYSLVKCINK